MTPEALLERVVALVPAATPLPLVEMRGQAVVRLPREHLVEAFTTLRDHADTRFEQLMDLTAVDYLGRTPRFEVVYQLHSLTHRHRLRVKVSVDEADAEVPTASGVWRSALWAERECFDMFGIRFAGHPDLRRLLLYAGFEGHPLRKDYPLMQRQPLVPERDPITQPWLPPAGGAR
ncbi:MAG TPA: NADH-quinone oxidoreductase subunit C [Candidatus Limnocylindria bacterium]|nr:NADH-quinone oxidoreductase subunit C [Candidatus Limnocylindria bacterium]